MALRAGPQAGRAMEGAGSSKDGWGHRGKKAARTRGWSCGPSTMWEGRLRAEIETRGFEPGFRTRRGGTRRVPVGGVCGDDDPRRVWYEVRVGGEDDEGPRWGGEEEEGSGGR